MRVKFIVMVLIVVLGVTTLGPAFAQTPLDKGLTVDYTGVIDHSKLFNGKPLYYDFHFLSYNNTVYYYELNIGANKGGEILKIPVVVRNLLNSTYFQFDFKAAPKITLNGIYKKTGKWLRIKGIVPKTCWRSQEDWRRIESLEAQDKILETLMLELDRCVDLMCVTH